MIDLYGMNSPNVRKILIAFEEIDLDYRFIHVDHFAKGGADPALAARNPLGKVPVIVDHDGAGEAAPIFESGAILLYLAERHGALLPADGIERTEVLQWQMVQVANIGPMFGQHNHFHLVRDHSDGYAADRYMDQARILYRLLDDRLAAVTWLAGSAYSIADIATWPWVQYIERHGFDPAEHPHLMRWSAMIAARPAVIRALAVIQPYEAADRKAMLGAYPAVLDRFFGRQA